MRVSFHGGGHPGRILRPGHCPGHCVGRPGHLARAAAGVSRRQRIAGRRRTAALAAASACEAGAATDGRGLGPTGVSGTITAPGSAHRGAFLPRFSPPFDDPSANCHGWRRHPRPPPSTPSKKRHAHANHAIIMQHRIRIGVALGSRDHRWVSLTRCSGQRCDAGTGPGVRPLSLRGFSPIRGGVCARTPGMDRGSTSAFPAVACVKKGHGSLFPQPARLLFRPHPSAARRSAAGHARRPSKGVRHAEHRGR